MLRRFLTLVVVFIFAFSILFVSVNNVTSASKSFAADSLTIVVESSSSAEVTPVATKSSYFLAYPGILPDNPLYKIKMIRDRLKIWFTGETVEKASLYLLYSDKRLGAGKILIEGGKPELGIPTLVKGERYFESAILETEKAKREGKDISLLQNSLKEASLKHEEILNEIMEKVDPSGKSAVEDIVKYMSPIKAKLNEF